MSGSGEPGRSTALRLKPRTLGALLGIVAAAVTIGLIVMRLIEAMAPVATPVSLRNASAEPIALERVRVDGQWVSQQPRGLNPGQALTTPAGRPLQPVPLRVARPALVEVAFGTTPAATLSCTLEPRPHGVCGIRILVRSPTQLACDYECAAPASAPSP